jgi:hypothetical protein
VSNVIDESDWHPSKHDDPRISTFRGITIDWMDEHENADDSIRVNRESVSNMIDESDWHSRKHDDPRISTFQGISMLDEGEKLRINLWSTTSIRKQSSKTNRPFPDSIKQVDRITSRNAVPSIDSTFRGITIDWSDEDENAWDSIRVNREFDSNVIDESDWYSKTRWWWKCIGFNSS